MIRVPSRARRTSRASARSERAARRIVTLAVVVVTAATATGVAPASAAVTARQAPHVMVLMMENESYGNVVGQVPYETRLTRTYETATNSYGVGHYSLDNYLAAVSGQFFSWSTGDCTPGKGCESSAPNIATQLSAAHITWAAYLGSMPRNCAQRNADSGAIGQSYGVRHNPFVYFRNLDPAQCSRIEPSSRMLRQLDSSSPPSFVWYSPQICHDGGNDDPCATLAKGDAFLSHEIPAIQRTRWYRAGGLIILTYDEGNGAGQGQGEYLRGAGNHVLTVLISKKTANKKSDPRYVNQFGLLASLEHTYRLRCLAQACRSANGQLPLPS